jgi:hypothetical protein
MLRSRLLQELADVHNELEALRNYKLENERYALSHSRVAPERVRELEMELQRVKQVALTTLCAATFSFKILSWKTKIQSFIPDEKDFSETKRRSQSVSFAFFRLGVIVFRIFAGKSEIGRGKSGTEYVHCGE